MLLLLLLLLLIKNWADSASKSVGLQGNGVFAIAHGTLHDEQRALPGWRDSAGEGWNVQKEIICEIKCK